MLPLLFFLSLLIILSCLPLTLRLVTVNSKIEIELHLSGICLYRWRGAGIWHKSTPENRQNWHEWQPIIRKILNYGEFTRFRCSLELGLGDIVRTAQAVGFFWGLLMIFIGYLEQLSHFNKVPEVAITPKYQELEWNFSLECILRVTIGHIIIAILENTIFGELKGAEAKYERTSD